VKTLLVTGGAGFIGSNFIRFVLKKHTDYHIVNLDALTYAGNPENLSDVADSPNYAFVKGDVRDQAVLTALFSEREIDFVVNFAAESHVDRSIIDPQAFASTNILGTQTLLDAATRHWETPPGGRSGRAFRPGVKFLQVSTDEVYGALGEEGRLTETSPLLPNSPYSASKASADLVVRAYHRTFGLPVNITRCSNNYGPFQFPEKLIPLTIVNCLSGRPLPVYGDGLQVRDWLHVSDHCEAIDRVLHGGAPGETYNIGGDGEKTNLEVVTLIARALHGENLITYVKDRPGHDRRYAVDASKLKSALGWRPRYDFEQGLYETIRWYQAHTVWIGDILDGSYRTNCQELSG